MQVSIHYTVQSSTIKLLNIYTNLPLGYFFFIYLILIIGNYGILQLKVKKTGRPRSSIFYHHIGYLCLI